MLVPQSRTFCRTAITIFILLGAIACSTGDLGRSEAKKKLSKTLDMCNPCFLMADAHRGLGLKLIQLGYVDRSTLEITSVGQQALGGNAVAHNLDPSVGVYYVAAFKKEVEEVTGISMRQETAEVQFNYQIIPLLNIVRDAPEDTLTTLNQSGFFNVRQMATVEEQGNKLIAIHTNGSARFKRYDDGWRVEHANDTSRRLDLNITMLGGLDRSVAIH
jgi:hypothetical protein